MSHSDYVELEHQTIRDGLNELFTFTAIRSDEKFNWGEETSTEEEEETESLYNLQTSKCIPFW